MASAEDFSELDRATADSDKVAISVSPSTVVFHELSCGKARAYFQRLTRQHAIGQGFRPANCCRGASA